ncbi:unnamed protein product [Rotaria magnacalcarata]|uniref:G-patch domain-containing protein n=2 Tax=Rotaria magnacalcarata TaxID=392030 RepID=A0A8S3GZT7_9BILA|nr:unnamed protein product [Rotaria magnacalcarata]
MDYEQGRGLGKTLQGRVEPIERQELEINELTETSKNHVGPTVLPWRKQQREKTPKQQHKQTQEKITDTTGREQRILRNYDSITTKQVFSLNELTHNLDLVIESCEESMIRSHRRAERLKN